MMDTQGVSEEVYSDIEKDVGRTFPGHPRQALTELTPSSYAQNAICQLVCFLETSIWAGALY